MANENRNKDSSVFSDCYITLRKIKDAKLGTALMNFDDDEG